MVYSDEEQKKIISENLTRLIKRSGKEQKQIAFAIDEKPTTLNRWVKGQTMPPVSALNNLANYFNVRLEDIVDENDGTYYLNAETAKIAQELYENEELRMLFDAGRNSKPQDLIMAADMLRRFKETNPNG